MGEPCLIGIDVGGTAAKAAVYSLQGHRRAISRAAYAPVHVVGGGLEYDSEQLFTSVCEAVRETLLQAQVAAADVMAVGMDGMISGTVGIDDEGRPTTPYTSTLDTRYRPFLDAVTERCAEAVRELTGSAKPTVGPKALWVRATTPDAFARTRSWVSATTYVGMRLAGLTADAAYVDQSQLWAYGLADARKVAWSSELCQAFDLRPDVLPRIVPSSEIVGGVSSAAAKATTLLAGTPIVAGLGDTLAGLLGAGVTRPGEAGDGAGTYSTLAACLSGYRAPTAGGDVHIVAGGLPGTWYGLSFVQGGGLFRSWCLSLLLGENPGADAVEHLAARAGAVAPGSDGLLFLLPGGTKSASTSPWAHGGWVGATLAHGPAHLYRSVMEAIAYRQVAALERIEQDNDIHVDRVLVYGGGAQEPRWNQIKSDIAERPYDNLGNSEVTSLGAALIAGFGVKAIDDPVSVAITARSVQARFVPNRAASGRYRVLRQTLATFAQDVAWLATTSPAAEP